MASLSRWWALAPLAAWTLFMWGVRLRNALDDAELVGSARTTSLTIAALFVAGGVMTLLVMVWWRQRSGLTSPLVAAVLVFAGGSIVYWAVRMVIIVFADHSIGFVVVHAVLALITALVGLVAIRGVWGQRPLTSAPWDSR